LSAVLAPIHDRALDDLRYYLRAWRRWVRDWRAPLGYPTSVPFVREMVPVVSGGWDTHDEEVDGHILRAIDAEVESLPADQRAAVRLVYLNEVTSAVFRSGRMSMESSRRLCYEAEIRMVPRLRVRGVVLGGC
jgi:hypothetical protein